MPADDHDLPSVPTSHDLPDLTCPIWQRATTLRDQLELLRRDLDEVHLEALQRGLTVPCGTAARCAAYAETAQMALYMIALAGHDLEKDLER